VTDYYNRSVKNKVEYIKREMDYYFELNSKIINCEGKRLQRMIEESKNTEGDKGNKDNSEKWLSVEELMVLYIEDFKTDLIDQIWKFVMVYLIQDLKIELRDEMFAKIIYSKSKDEIMEMMVRDKEEVKKAMKLKESLDEIEKSIIIMWAYRKGTCHRSIPWRDIQRRRTYGFRKQSLKKERFYSCHYTNYQGWMDKTC